MKLFYILPEYSSEISGHFRYNVELLEELSKEMKVYLFIEKGEKPHVKNIQHVRVGRFQFLPLRVLERILVFKWARLRGYRRFYSHYGYLSAILAGLICKLSFGKMYFWHCEMRGNYESSGCTLCHLPAKVSKDWPFRLVLKLCTDLVTCTEKMREYYISVFCVKRQKIHVVYNWVDTQKLVEEASRRKGKNPTILFVHWLSPRKGTRILPMIFQLVKQKMPSARLLVAGEGPDMEWLEGEWERNGLTSSVTMLGAVPNRKINELYGRSHVLLHPSREEEFGRVLIEAMACGLPIVASSTYGAESILNEKQKKFVFDYEKPEEGAEMCVKLLKSEEKQKELSKIGLSHVKKFDKEVIVRRFLDLFSL
ncbi:glycosyltransferase family 4 protein [Patescibacteria group bacterium]|nr:glycosyltransferase family 4 protein [Patescibacteria group bacterium]